MAKIRFLSALKGLLNPEPLREREISVACVSDTGRRRANNEDNYWCLGECLAAENKGSGGLHTGRLPSPPVQAFAVFDGMGGESCGEIAAFLAAENFGKQTKTEDMWKKDEPVPAIKAICEGMNTAVLDYQKSYRIRSMAATAAMAFVLPREVWCANLGDSRIYTLMKDELVQVSTDHVLRGYRLGKPPITQYLGFDDEDSFLEPAIIRLGADPGRRILLCTDGLTDMVPDERIQEILKSEGETAKAAEKLWQEALRNGGRDNITLLLIDI